MTIHTIPSCPTCGYPIAVNNEGQTEVCAYCGEKVEAIAGGASGFWLFVVGIGLGVFLGPAIISSSKGGRAWLEKQARETEAALRKS